MIVKRNVSVCGWSVFKKWSRSTSSPKKNQHLWSHEHAYDHRRVSNEMATPKTLHDVTTPIENLAGFILRDLLQIAIFAKYFSSVTAYNIRLWIRLWNSNASQS